MDQFTLIQRILIWAIPLIFAVTFHEMAHGWVASLRGDQTAKRLGRLSPNPLRHVDPVGTVLVPAVLFLLHAGFLFGWAKPVPVDWRNLKRPRLDMALVAVAGPAANIVMALIWAMVAKVALVSVASHPWIVQVLFAMGTAGIAVNLMLAIFNLIPIPPLDGSRIVSRLLKPAWAYHYDKIERYSIWILMILLATHILSAILSPILRVALGIVLHLFGL